MTAGAHEIARGLTKAQREIVLRAGENPRPAYALHPDSLGVTAAGILRRGVMPDLFLRSWPTGSQHQFYRLSPLGLRVKAALMAMPGGGA